MDPIAKRKTRLQECDQGTDVGGFANGWKIFPKGSGSRLPIFPTVTGLR